MKCIICKEYEATTNHVFQWFKYQNHPFFNQTFCLCDECTHTFRAGDIRELASVFVIAQARARGMPYDSDSFVGVLTDANTFFSLCEMLAAYHDSCLAKLN
jgi:hypothetical protein